MTDLQAEPHAGPNQGDNSRTLLESKVSNDGVLLHLFQEVVDPCSGHDGSFVVFTRAKVVGAAIFQALEGLDFQLESFGIVNTGPKFFGILDAENRQDIALLVR